MKKLRVAFAATMLMIMVLTAGVMAAASMSNDVRGIGYQWQTRSSKVQFNAVGKADYREDAGATSVCYTQIDNISGNSQPVYVSVRSYILGSGWTPIVSETATIEPGSSLKTGSLSRYFNKADRFYYHTGLVYVATGTTIVQEEFIYKANQI